MFDTTLMHFMHIDFAYLYQSVVQNSAESEKLVAFSENLPRFLVESRVTCSRRKVPRIGFVSRGRRELKF